MLRECYLPTFEFAKDAPSAQQAFLALTRKFFHLPESSSQPGELARLIQRLIFHQQALKIIVPECPRHELRMVLVGKAGARLVRPRAKLSMNTLHEVGNGGKMWVRRGLFRCPHPGCFTVAPVGERAPENRLPEKNARLTIRRAEEPYEA